MVSPGLSLWHDTLPEGAVGFRPPLDGSVDADVVIVGAGYTGLWAAYYLAGLAPGIDVRIVESSFAGYGASGRNGGWASFELALDREEAARSHGRPAVERLLREVCASVDEIGRVVALEEIECGYVKGGSLTFARNPVQVERVRQAIAAEWGWGFGEEDFHWLGAEDAIGRARMEGALGAMETPHCATVQPAALARGLAEAAERRGVTIYERTRAIGLEPGRVRTEWGDIRAPVVLGCTEAFTVGLPGGRRRLVPLYSLMVATEPLGDETWGEIGLEGRPTFTDGRRLVVYGQRTADGRLAFGGRGALYRFGSAVRPDLDRDQRVHAGVTAALRDLFPQIGNVRITHEWGGAVAVPRDWKASVIFDEATGMGSAGGYVGAGVAASNLAGRTLADLVLRRPTDLVGLPWVGRGSRPWEPEPLRWVGVNAGLVLAGVLDAREARRGREPRLLAGLFDALTGQG